MKNILKSTLFSAIVAALIVFAFTLTPAFAQSKKPRKPVVKKSIPRVASSGLLYKISGKSLTKPSYLFGTIHIVCPANMFSMDRLKIYFGETQRLTLELDMDDAVVNTKMATALNMPEGKTLQDFLSPEKYAKVDEMFKSVLGVPVAVLKQFNPLGLSVIISASPKSIGCSAPASYETTFVSMATDAKYPVEGLESVEDQVAALAKTPIEKQAEDLYKLALDPQKAMTQFKELTAIYNMQDSDKLNEFIAKMSAESPEFVNDLLDERNRTWIPRIEKMIAEKPTFIAVGGGHLGGKNGVVNLLRKEGFTVTPIRF